MCLESLDKRPKNHKVGFKICSVDDDGFGGQVYDTGPYHIGGRYDSKFSSIDLPTVVVSSIKDQRYLAGFHYFLKLKDARKLVNRGEVVIRIEVEKILATGIQNGYQAGVSEYMTLTKVSFDPEVDMAKEFLKVCKGKVESQLLTFAKEFQGTFRIPAKELKKVVDYMTQSLDVFTRFISLVDCFPRQSKAFKTYTKIHLWGLKNEAEYKKLYHYVVAHIDELSDELRRSNYSELMQYSADIDDFVIEHF